MQSRIGDIEQFKQKINNILDTTKTQLNIHKRKLDREMAITIRDYNPISTELTKLQKSYQAILDNLLAKHSDGSSLYSLDLKQEREDLTKLKSDLDKFDEAKNPNCIKSDLDKKYSYLNNSVSVLRNIRFLVMSKIPKILSYLTTVIEKRRAYDYEGDGESTSGISLNQLNSAHQELYDNLYKTDESNVRDSVDIVVQNIEFNLKLL